MLQRQRNIWVNISNMHNSWDNEGEIRSKWVNKHMVRLSPTLFISTIKMYDNEKIDILSVAKEGTPALCNKQEYNKPLSYYKS